MKKSGLFTNPERLFFVENEAGLDMKAVGKFLFSLTLLSCGLAWAVTEVLPQGINSPMFKYGFVQGLNQKFNQSGELWRLGDLNSIEFNAQTLAKVNPQAQVLINALNRFGNQRLGDALNLGVLEFNIDPKVSYFAPVYARGITNTWTMAMALPVVTYKNSVKVSRSFSNIDFYKSEFGGKFPELDQALNTDLGAETLKAIASAGYKPLNEKNETFFHDMQLISMYKFFEGEKISFIHSAYLTLPTGPQYDPDDLAALNISHYTALDNGVTGTYKMDNGISLNSTLSYQFYLPRDVVKRVPKNEDDVLPDTTTKESVKMAPGAKATIRNEISYKIFDKYGLGVGHSYTKKDSDAYKGGQGRRYDLLSLRSASNEQNAFISLSYDTVKSYFKKQALIPMIVSYDVSDTIAGVNIERKLVQELNLILFF